MTKRFSDALVARETSQTLSTGAKDSEGSWRVEWGLPLKGRMGVGHFLKFLETTHKHEG